MYCIKCGVELSKGQTVCPLCQTKVYHPELNTEDIPTYPKKDFKSEEFNIKGLMFIITVLCVLPLLLPPVIELSWKDRIDWSGYVIGGVLLGYLCFLLPLWFKAPNPVVFIPCDLAGATLLLWYINLQTGGEWFLSFALPIAMSLCVIITAMASLIRYLQRGKLYIFGGGFIAFGAWTVLMDFLLRVTFKISPPIWSVYSFIPLFLIGMMLIIIAIVRPLRESLTKKFFIK